MIPKEILVLTNILAYNIMHKSYLWYLSLLHYVVFIIYFSSNKACTSTTKRYYGKLRRFLILTNTVAYIQTQWSPSQFLHSQ